MKFVAPLTSFDTKQGFKLADDISVLPISKELREAIELAQVNRLIRHPLETKWFIEYDSRGKSVDLAAARKQIEEVVIRLRVFKAGDVGFSIIIHDKNNYFANPKRAKPEFAYQAMFFYFVWKRPGLDSGYYLNPNELGDLRMLFAKSKGRTLMDQTAYRYFFRAYHEPYGTDRFLSNVIGLENVLVNDQKDHGNIGYKFADRGSFLLRQVFPKGGTADQYVKSLKEIYTKRSKIVHAGKTQIGDMDRGKDKDLLVKSDGYLRSLLSFLLFNPDYLKAENIDRKKRDLY